MLTEFFGLSYSWCVCYDEKNFGSIYFPVGSLAVSRLVCIISFLLGLGLCLAFFHNLIAIYKCVCRAVHMTGVQIIVTCLHDRTAVCQESMMQKLVYWVYLILPYRSESLGDLLLTPVCPIEKVAVFLPCTKWIQNQWEHFESCYPNWESH